MDPGTPISGSFPQGWIWSQIASSCDQNSGNAGSNPFKTLAPASAAHRFALSGDFIGYRAFGSDLDGILQDWA